MNKKFAIAIVMVVIGASTVIGSGAYSAAEMNRDANIDVVNDADGLVAITSGTDSDVVRETGNGDLTVDFTAAGNAGGVNVDSRYQVGDMSHSAALQTNGFSYSTNPHGEWNYAFVIENRDTVPHNITVTYEADETPGDSQVVIETRWRQFNQGYIGAMERMTISSSNPRDSVSPGPWYSDQVKPGGEYYVSILVDTRGGSTADDVSGTITITST